MTRSRVETSLTDRATILRYRELDPDDPDVETNAIGEVEGDSSSDSETSLEVVAEDVRCAFESRSTSYVREDTGERVQRPAVATFSGSLAAELEEGDVVDVDGQSTRYEIRGLDESTDHRRGLVVSVEADLERSG